MFAIKWMQRNNSLCTPTLKPHDSALLKEIIGGIDSNYFSLAVDCVEYEIHQNLAHQYRDQKVIMSRVEALEKQSDAVCRQLSSLILEKQPQYQRELKNVVLLQEVNGAAYEECIEARRSLEVLLKSVVERRAIVIRNYKRRFRLKRVLETLKCIRSLQNSVIALNKLIEERKFCEAISLHRQSCQTTEDFKSYTCVDLLQQSLRAVNHKIDDALDGVLAESCENFDPIEYAALQEAFERLGSTMTTVAQLQLHYTTKIHERAAAILTGFYGTASTEDAKHVTEYERICAVSELMPDDNRSLPATTLVTALSSLAKSLWTILVCYHRTALWHESASQRGHDGNHDAATENDREEAIHTPELVCQWHGYVASKLGLNRGRVWMDLVSRVRPLLSSIATNSKQLTFEEIVATLNIVNRLVRVGEEFAGHMSFDLLEMLKNSTRGFFGEFHRMHMERLRLFLDHEGWEHVPVRPGFSLFDLHEFHTLTDLFAPNGDAFTAIEPGVSGSPSPSRENLFKEPYDCHFFDLGLDDSKIDQKGSLENDTELPVDGTVVGENSDQLTPSKQVAASSSPILASTTIEVFRLFGRYLQMMRLLRPIASEVMHCIGQIFDYYLFVVYSLFGKSFTLKEDAAQLPERLRKTLSRISTRLIAPAGHSCVENGSRFVVPDCILSTSNRDTMGADQMASMEDIINHLRRHLVGVESLVFLSSVLEKDLLPHLRDCLPESKRGLLDAFRDQSLITTLDVREATARHLASCIFPCLLLLGGHPNRNSLADKDAAHLLRQMVATNPGWASNTVATEPSAYLQSLNAAISRLASALKALPPPSIPPPAMRALWMGAMAWISAELLEGLAGVYDCTEEGRSQMLLDVQSAAVLCETESGIRPFVKLNLLVDYIQAFFVPTREWSNWLESTGVHRYTQRQSLGLAHCLARGDKHARQRLLAAVTTVYARHQQSVLLHSGVVGGSGIEA
ncbi:Coiled-coil domain-containing protein [Echinococcus granulosus]|uniref:Coiled-coil domain-containing protein n=1 Tax=Echinococcus granulosus TaxID=6210 RepID=W6U8P7_ECHGR|nr:Coiled-coil domain-containing protein [Echinococcus granulosus]EUB56811.1 Coiled-coil domain-containing protein [Echinococcus granulosus]